MDLSARRTEYEAEGLDEGDLVDDPIEQFQRWMDDAVEAMAPEPSAMVLSTIDAAGHPRGRTVLLRGLDERGFVFYTNYESTKAGALDQTNVASLTFHWIELHRQVIVEGTVERVSAEESDSYFATRPRGSQLGAWASIQSAVIPGRQELIDALLEVTARFEGIDVARPPFWGGYRVRPTIIEFWQGQPSRLHDRIRYSTAPDGSWVRERLSP